MQIEKLLTLGDAQGLDYEKLAKAGFELGGKRGGITGLDVHLAMSWLPPEQRAIMYLRPNPARVTATDLATLTNYLWISLIRFEASRRPTYSASPGAAILAALRANSNRVRSRQALVVSTALAEFVDSKLCRSCAGSKYPGRVAEHFEGYGIVYTACKACNGRTWIPWSDNRRAAAVKGTREYWRTRNEPGYLNTLELCSLLVREGTEAFKTALFGPALIEETMQANT